MANGQSAVITMKQLLEAGVHFGHQTKRWNPKMTRYIFTARNGIYIIDLQQTVKMFRAAYETVRTMAAVTVRPSLSFTPCFNHCQTWEREISAVAASSIRL